MDYVTNREQRIAFDVAGDGDDTVVLLPGLGQRRADWADAGCVAGLAHDFRVISVDSLGHGDSGCPADCSLYAPLQRAGDVVAVLHRVDVASAHLIGYSMGGWIASAVLVHAPARVRSLCAGGWDPVRGMAGVRERLGVDLDFDVVLGGFRRAYPQVTGWITPEREVALRCCFDAVEDLDGVERTLYESELPILLWDGVDDPHHDSSRQLAAQLPNAEFLETAGDHAAAFYNAGREAVPGLLAFLRSASQADPRRSTASPQ
jgi:pimeloyl-ACP methyl ester carboxylesterase